MIKDDLDEFDEIDSTISYEPKNLMVVDTLNYCFKYKHKGISSFATAFFNDIRSFAKSYKAKKVVLLGDLRGSKYRKDKYPEYKANRDKLKAEQSEEDRKFFEEFLTEYSKIMDMAKDKYLTIREEGIEADDLAAFIAKNCKDDYQEIWLISSDKDWDLLVEDNIKRFSYVTRKEYAESTWDEVYDIPHSLRLDIKVLQGDTGDNLPGVPGVGPKRAVSILREYGSVMDIYDNIPLPGKQKFIENLNSSKDIILRNLELMDIYSNCEEAIATVNPSLLSKIIEDINVRN